MTNIDADGRASDQQKEEPLCEMNGHIDFRTVEWIYRRLLVWQYPNRMSKSLTDGEATANSLFSCRKSYSWIIGTLVFWLTIPSLLHETTCLHERSIGRPPWYGQTVDDDEGGVDPQLIIFASIAGGDNQTRCDHVRDSVYRGDWEDPNQGKVFLRKVVTEPSFFVSVHDKTYDPIRFGSIFEKGDYYEKRVRERFEYILSEHQYELMPLVLDVGGNIGYYTLLSSAWNHYVITFELNPSNIIRLCESTAQNQFDDQVAIYRVGLSNTTGRLHGFQVGWNPGEVGLLDENDKKNTLVTDFFKGNETKSMMNKFTATTITLDDFVTQRGWYDRNDINISLWKLDTEGHEPHILEGSRRFIQSRLAKNILLEFRPQTRTAADLLLDAGYVIVVDSAKGEKRLLSPEDSSQFLDSETIRISNSKNMPYADHWFRLAELSFQR